MTPIFFRSPAEMRAWFEQHHATAGEVLVGFYKKASGEQSITWPESVDEALCVGWIDGVRRGVDERRYTIRFTPRRKGSVWSAVNIGRVAVLSAEGRMRPAGLAAFAVRREDRSRIYTYEQQPADLAEPYLGLLKQNPAAWEFFRAQPPYYRKSMSHWIAGAKQEATRLKRLAKLADASANERRAM